MTDTKVEYRLHFATKYNKVWLGATTRRSKYTFSDKDEALAEAAAWNKGRHIIDHIAVVRHTRKLVPQWKTVDKEVITT